MTRFQVCFILAAIGWTAILATALAWLRGAAIGSERVDQTFADHFDREDDEPVPPHWVNSGRKVTFYDYSDPAWRTHFEDQP